MTGSCTNIGTGCYIQTGTLPHRSSPLSGLLHWRSKHLFPGAAMRSKDGASMAEPSEEAVLKRAKELWEKAGYTDGAEARSVSGLGGPLPRARVLLTPARLQEFIQQARNELRQKGVDLA